MSSADLPSSDLVILTGNGTTQSLDQVIVGTADSGEAGSTVSLFDNGSTNPVASATVGTDGSWSAHLLLAHDANAITASLTDASGRTATSNTVDITLENVTSPISNAASAPSPAAASASPIYQRVDNGDGTHTITGHRGHMVLGALPNSTLTGEGAHTTFVFGFHPGQSVVTDFHAEGFGHDVLSLPAARFGSVAAVLHHTQTIEQDAVISVGPHETITLQGVTAAELRAHPGDFRFH